MIEQLPHSPPASACVSGAGPPYTPRTKAEQGLLDFLPSGIFLRCGIRHLLGSLQPVSAGLHLMDERAIGLINGALSAGTARWHTLPVGILSRRIGARPLLRVLLSSLHP